MQDIMGHIYTNVSLDILNFLLLLPDEYSPPKAY